MNADKDGIKQVLETQGPSRRSISLLWAAGPKTFESQVESQENNVPQSMLTSAREKLIPISNDSTVTIGNQQSLPLANKMQVNACEDKENMLANNVDLFTKLPNMEDESATNNNNKTDNDDAEQLEVYEIKDLEFPVEEEMQPAVEDLHLPFSIGDQVWAYISGYPLWPAIITQDPLEINLYTRTKRTGKRQYHLDFFGDGTHSWISESFLFPFKGTVFEFLQDKLTRTKSKIFKSLEQAMKGNNKTWELAMEDAKKLLPISKEMRVLAFKEYTQSKSEETEMQRKRKTTENAVVNKAKRRRQSLDESIPNEDPTIQNEHSETLSDVNKQSEDVKEENKVKEKVDDSKDITKFEKKKKNTEKRTEVCLICQGRENSPIPCTKCRLVYHLHCSEEISGTEPNAESFLCHNCDPSSHPRCCICQKLEGEMLCCILKTCGRRYHLDCLKVFHSPSAKQAASQFKCPTHCCHTCVAEMNELPEKPEKKLLRCILCPTAYHSNGKCLPAGCIQLSTSQIKCFKHVDGSKTTKKTGKANRCNVDYCVICSQGGKLICCDRCPLSFHIRCVGLDEEPTGSYLCPECTLGKSIMYGDIVWVKMGIYRWWPCRVLPLDEIPPRHQKNQPGLGQFRVYFYGTRETAMVYRGQVYHHHEEDQGCKRSGTTKLNSNFKLALEEVKHASQQRKLVLGEQTAERQKMINSKPPPYNKIHTNKPIGKFRTPYSRTDTSCTCVLRKGQKNVCGSDSACLNRLLQCECDPAVCVGKELCQNQRFQRRESPDLFHFSTGGKGFGLKSTVDIKKGAFVIEYVGEIIDNNEFRSRLKAKQDAGNESFYFLTLDNNRMIDAGPSGNLARFMNHSCQPNCETQKWTVLGDIRVGIFALMDIPAGTELTFNYELKCAEDVTNESNQRQQPCRCGAPNCLGFIGAKPKQLKVENAKTFKTKEKKSKCQRKLENGTVAEDFCFYCKEGGHLVLCDVKTCHKVYHVECLNRTTPPKGKWICPRHLCDDCGQKSVQFCQVCPKSLCSKHAIVADWQPHDQLGVICNEHSPEDAELFVKWHMEEEMKSVTENTPEPSTSTSYTRSR